MSADACTAPRRVDPVEAAEFLDRHRLGRRGALDELIRMCEPFVRAQARRFAWSSDDIDDVVQEVWIKLMLHASRIDDPQSLLAWLQMVTRRVASSIGQRSKRCIPTDLIDDDMPAVPSTEDIVVAFVDSDDRQRVVTSALRRLDAPDQRLLLLLHCESRPGYDRISLQVDRPIGSLGPTRQRLLQRLRRDNEICQLAEGNAAA